jgi:hypothetical protein
MGLFKRRNNCYCAFCRSPRRIYRKKNISFLNIVASIFASLIFMLVMWRGFDPRVCIAVVVCLGIAEVFVKIRWRLSVVCRQCGFDPVLYKKDPSEAALKVRAQLEVRRQDPRYLLVKPLILPTLSAEKAQALSGPSKGKLVSRSI